MVAPVKQKHRYAQEQSTPTWSGCISWLGRTFVHRIFSQRQSVSYALSLYNSVWSIDDTHNTTFIINMDESNSAAKNTSSQSSNPSTALTQQHSEEMRRKKSLATQTVNCAVRTWRETEEYKKADEDTRRCHALFFVKEAGSQYGLTFTGNEDLRKKIAQLKDTAASLDKDIVNKLKSCYTQSSQSVAAPTVGPSWEDVVSNFDLTGIDSFVFGHRQPLDAT